MLLFQNCKLKDWENRMETHLGYVTQARVLYENCFIAISITKRGKEIPYLKKAK